MTSSEIDRLEDFLDTIENPNENIVLKFQRELPHEEIRSNDVEEEKAIRDGDVVKDGDRKCVFKGVVDSNGNPTGNGALAYPNKDVFMGVFKGAVGNRKGVLKSHEADFVLEAEWKRGQLDGFFVRESRGKATREEGFYGDGLRHGYFRRFGPSCWGRGEALELFGRYHLGRLSGVCWKGLLGGGYIVGKVDERGEFSGDEISFLYPDFRSAIKGTFIDGVLESGKFGFVVGSKNVDGILMPKVEVTDSDVIYEFDRSTTLHLSSNPLLSDPWEATLVEVKASDIQGDGLFALTDLEDGTIIAFFNGVRIPTDGRKKSLEFSDYRIGLNPDVDLDIPDEAKSVQAYRATLGHKANHSFEPNAEWTVFEHPRFGLIRAIAALKDIQEGEEILVDYKIPMDKAPNWYLLLWMKHVETVKCWTENDIRRFIERQSELTGKRISLPDSSSGIPRNPKGATLLTELF